VRRVIGVGLFVYSLGTAMALDCPSKPLANTPKQQHRIGIAGDVVVGVTLDRVSRHRDAGAAGQNFVRI